MCVYLNPVQETQRWNLILCYCRIVPLLLLQKGSGAGNSLGSLAGLLHCAHCMMWNCVHSIHRINSSSFPRTALVWAITWQTVVIPYGQFRATHWSHILGSRWDPMCCLKPSVRNYHSSLCNSPRGSQFSCMSQWNLEIIQQLFW